MNDDADRRVRSNAGLGGLFDEAAAILEELRGWTDAPAVDEKRFSSEVPDLVERLRQAAKYHKINPLGGPARMFYAVADRLRAGEALEDVLSDYGLAQSPVAKVYIQCPLHCNSPWPMMKVGFSPQPVPTCPNCELSNEPPNVRAKLPAEADGAWPRKA